jgi:NADH dehydrogenase
LPLFPLFYIFFIASIAETNRAPFDLAEAESELVSGFMTEHAAGIFVFFFLGEYASIILICILITLILLGGYEIMTIIFFLENILNTFISFFFASIYTVFLNLKFFLLCFGKFFQENSNIQDIYTFNLFNILNSIQEGFQFNQYLDIVSYNYNNYMKYNIEYVLYGTLERLNFSNNFNIIVDIFKNISDSKILLSLIYALGISIKTIILIFSFI